MVSVLLNVCIITCLGKPYYRFINLLYALTWTTVMSFIINQLMMIFIAIIILKEQNRLILYEFTNKIESVQYNAALAITGCVRGTSMGKLFLELGLTSLYDRRRLHRFTLLYKILNDLTPQYLRRFIPNSISRLQNTRTNREETMDLRPKKNIASFLNTGWPKKV